MGDISQTSILPTKHLRIATLVQKNLIDRERTFQRSIRIKLTHNHRRISFLSKINANVRGFLSVVNHTSDTIVFIFFSKSGELANNRIGINAKRKLGCFDTIVLTKIFKFRTNAASLTSTILDAFLSFLSIYNNAASGKIRRTIDSIEINVWIENELFKSRIYLTKIVLRRAGRKANRNTLAAINQRPKTNRTKDAGNLFGIIIVIIPFFNCVLLQTSKQIICQLTTTHFNVSSRGMVVGSRGATISTLSFFKRIPKCPRLCRTNKSIIHSRIAVDVTKTHCCRNRLLSLLKFMRMGKLAMILGIKSLSQANFQTVSYIWN